MENKTKQISTFSWACGFAIVIGAIEAIMGVAGAVGEIAKLGTVAGNLSTVALFFVLLLIGALHVAGGVLGLKSKKNEKLRNTCNSLGWVMLIATAAYVVSNVFLRGFAWSTTLGLFVSIAYMGTLKFS